MNKEGKKNEKMEMVQIPACGMRYGYCCYDCMYMSRNDERDGKYYCGRWHLYEDPAHAACSSLEKRTR